MFYNLSPKRNILNSVSERPKIDKLLLFLTSTVVPNGAVDRGIVT